MSPDCTSPKCHEEVHLKLDAKADKIEVATKLSKKMALWLIAVVGLPLIGFYYGVGHTYNRDQVALKERVIKLEACITNNMAGITRIEAGLCGVQQDIKALIKELGKRMN